MKQLIVIIVILITTFSFAQEGKDKSLQKSNDYVYQGNVIVDEDFVAAEKEYRKAISEKPSNTTGAYNLGNAYYKTGLFNEALQRHLETAKLATTKKEKHQAFHNMGNALMQQKQCKEAVEAFKNALRNDPTDEETRYNLVIAKECAEQQGDGGGGDNDKENEDKKDQENKDKKEGDDEKDENKDKGDDKEDNKEGDDKEDKDGKPKDDRGDNKDSKNEKKEQKQQSGKLSPQQVRNLLEAMNNQEKKVQEKINAKKVKGEKVKTEKDW
ncbi:MAG: aerotolerance regulator BatC [Bacteroidetes bacterium]|nr:aerotolerance regulator BatC [Bacteroidota bacterium]